MFYGELPCSYLWLFHQLEFKAVYGNQYECQNGKYTPSLGGYNHGIIVLSRKESPLMILYNF